MKLLLFSVDSGTIATLVPFLKAAGHTVETANDEEDAAAFLDAGLAIDVAIVDCAPAGTLHDAIAGLKVRPPILAFTDPLPDRKVVTELLDSGADDALRLPLDMAELLARLRALRRRSVGVTAAVVTVGQLSWDPARQIARVADKQLHLTGKESRLFEALIMRPGQLFTKEQLLSALYSDRDEPDLKIIDVFVCKIRKKIAAALDGNGAIETVWGRGYMLPRADAESRLAA